MVTLIKHIFKTQACIFVSVYLDCAFDFGETSTVFCQMLLCFCEQAEAVVNVLAMFLLYCLVSQCLVTSLSKTILEKADFASVHPKWVKDQLSHSSRAQNN